jgi:hypothetical protein
MRIQITGKVCYKDIEGGFWGIITQEDKFLILNMPEQLKYEGAMISCTIETKEDVFSIYNWGTPAFISSFTTQKFAS